MNADQKILITIFIALALFAGCATNTQTTPKTSNNQTLYTCPDGSKISDLNFCPTTTIVTTTTTTTTLYQHPKPEHLCRINESNNACTDDNGTYYPVGSCIENVKNITFYDCDSMGWWCEEKEFEHFDCATIQKICIETSKDDKLLLNSSLSIVRCINPRDTNQSRGQNITVIGK